MTGNPTEASRTIHIVYGKKIKGLIADYFSRSCCATSVAACVAVVSVLCPRDREVNENLK